MAKKERIREAVSGFPSIDSLVQRGQNGWRLVAMEWEREIVQEPTTEQPPQWTEEIPYGLQVSSDCTGLVESPAETQVIVLALDMIVEDCPLSRVADELNRRGFHTRAGKPWSPGALFNLLPRMIQVGPRVFASEEWTTRRQRLPRVV